MELLELMDLDGQFKLGHLLLSDRRCRSCGEVKDLVDGFYKTRKGSGPSAYSYECKECTKVRVVKNRKTKKSKDVWEYPDW